MALWPHLTSPALRELLRPSLVWQEICSYIKGSAQAMDTDAGYITKEQYLQVTVLSASPAGYASTRAGGRGGGEGWGERVRRGG